MANLRHRLNYPHILVIYIPIWQRRIMRDIVAGFSFCYQCLQLKITGLNGLCNKH